MTSRTVWFVAFLALSIGSTVLIANTSYPYWMKSIGDALAWGLYGSGVFLGATLMFGITIAANRDAPLPGWLAGLGVVAFVGGVIWALLSTVMLGL